MPWKKFFNNLRNPFLDMHIRNGIPKFESSRLNSEVEIERNHISTDLYTRSTYKHPTEIKGNT